ncbi:8469_t:CDS:1 [Racocetra fulgida]|uniref:8469_t:CDS:1 n=1 Tax=Racocetra fulgida TaxID=60492 RepID=A0A9N8VWL7_9GLOM|nr:8469_t:CDS:1 [Racocetra fulgida]
MPEKKKITFEIRKIRAGDFLHEENGEKLARFCVEPFFYSEGIRSGEKIHRLLIQYTNTIEDIEQFRRGNIITLEIDRDLANTSFTRLNKFHISSDQYGNETNQILRGNIDEYMGGMGVMFGCQLHELVIKNKSKNNCWKVLEVGKNKKQSDWEKFYELTKIIVDDPYDDNDKLVDFNIVLAEAMKLKSNYIEGQLKRINTELEELVRRTKKKLVSDAEKEWFEVYLESGRENQYNSFIYKQAERARNNLKQRLNKEELDKIRSQQHEISELGMKLEKLQIQERQVQAKIPQKKSH